MAGIHALSLIHIFLKEGFNYTPGRFALGITEAPRGEDIHWSMLGDNQKLFRWRCRCLLYTSKIQWLQQGDFRVYCVYFVIALVAILLSIALM